MSYPRQFGNYLLLSRMAVGGMAEIFKARVEGAEGFEKDIVIKRILPSYSDDESFVKMFIDEARLTAKLQHPNIVQIHDFDELEGSYYIAMEYIEGRDLKDVLERAEKQGEKLSIAQTIWIGMHVAKALAYAHTKEDRGVPLHIVHRDVTPSNIMLSYRGDVKLMDFGIAKATQRTTKTQVGALKGKVAYMSPEQALNKEMDGRSDIFALGVVLWEMLTRERLFEADSDYRTVEQVLKKEAPSVREYNPEIPEEIAEIVAKALEKDVTVRWENADALASALTRWYYTHVADLDAEHLQPLMGRLFAEEIKRLATPIPEGTATTIGRRMETRVDSRTRIERGGQTASGGALVGADAMVTEHGGAEEEDEGGAKWPWVVLLLLLVGIGVMGVLLWGQEGKDEAPQEAVTTTLYLKVSPYTAKVWVNGEEAADEVPGLTVGDRVRVVAEAAGYQRYEELLTVEGGGPVLAIEMEPDGVEKRVFVRPSGAEDKVFVNNEALGVGVQAYDGVEGEDIVIRVETAGGGEPVSRIVRLDESVTTVDIETIAVVSLKLKPAEAEVKSSVGTVERGEEGEVLIRDLPFGKVVSLEISAPGHQSRSHSLTPGQAEIALSFELEATPTRATRPTTTPTGSRAGSAGQAGSDTPRAAAKKVGSIQASATPWAQVSVDGRLYGTTPKTIMNLDEGSYTVTFRKGQRTETRTVKVVGGKTARVSADFSE